MSDYVDDGMDRLNTKAFSEDKQPEAKHAGPRVYDINDQVKVVTKWWKEIQKSDLEEQKLKGNHNGMERPQIPINEVAKKLISWKIFMDMSATKKYLI